MIPNINIINNINININKYCIIKLAIFLFYSVDNVFSLVCPLPSMTIGGSARNKTCPDFKADPSFQYCCTSKLPVSNVIYKERHGVFCCSEQEYQREQQEIKDAEFRNFIRNYLAVIIFGTIVGICILTGIATCICKKYNKCGLRTHNNANHHNLTPSMYRPVDTIPPKIYEAPPPYECFVPPPEQGRHDWNCVLENEVNGSRRLAPLTQ